MGVIGPGHRENERAEGDSGTYMCFQSCVSYLARHGGISDPKAISGLGEDKYQ